MRESFLCPRGPASSGGRRFKTRVRVVSLLASLIFFGCDDAAGTTEDSGGDLVDIEGGVMGTSLPSGVRGFVHHRLANTPLNGPDPELDFHFGSSSLVADFCPEVLYAVDVDEPYLAFAVHARTLEVGTYEICTDIRCEGPRAEASGTFGGWQDPSLGGVPATGGIVDIATLDDNRVSGTFAIEFDEDVVSGSFALDISCVDDR